MPEISQETALAAQEKAMTGLLTGSIELTSSEFSSLVTGLIQANAPNLPLDEVSYCFSPDDSYVKITTTEGSLIEMVGDQTIEDNRFVVSLQAMSLNGQTLDEATLDTMVGAVNRALDDPSLAVDGTIEYGDDVVTMTLGQ